MCRIRGIQALRRTVLRRSRLAWAPWFNPRRARGYVKDRGSLDEGGADWDDRAGAAAAHSTEDTTRNGHQEKRRSFTALGLLIVGAGLHLYFSTSSE